MNDLSFLPTPVAPAIKTIDMHTTGEPTRIIYAGFPNLTGTLLAQRAMAKADHDHIRRLVIHEPRGHREMYGAVLRPQTEHTDDSPDSAHMGVLFLTHDGYSTMCGHATLAVARMLIDCTDIAVFPRRDKLNFPHNTNSGTVELRLHVPCGVVHVTVPVKRQENGGWASDPSLPVRYASTPSFAPGLSIQVPVPEISRWEELGSRSSVTVDVAYGGAFFLLVSAAELGFSGPLTKADTARLRDVTAHLKAAFACNDSLRRYLHHPDHADLQFLYSVMVTYTAGSRLPNTVGAETGLCFFGTERNWQTDRSPTGSGVQARVAAAVSKGQRQLGQAWTYHSVLSAAPDCEHGAFTGTATQQVEIGDYVGVIVEVSGQAFYTGYSTFLLEPETDKIGRGFDFEA